MSKPEFSSVTSADELSETMLYYAGGLLARHRFTATRPIHENIRLLTEQDVHEANDHLSDLGLGKAHAVSVGWRQERPVTDYSLSPSYYSPYVRYETERLTTIFSVERASDGSHTVRKRLEPPEGFTGVYEPDIERDEEAPSEALFDAFVHTRGINCVEPDVITALNELFTKLF
jgi:hypothetical protein